MAIPDNNGNGTNTPPGWSLQTVSNEVDPSKSQLTQLFSVASGQVPSQFDPNHEGNKDQLLNFRNYGGTFAYQMTSTYASPATACAALLLPNTVYFLNNIISDSVFVYTDPALTTLFVGNGGFYKVIGNAFTVIQISNGGSVMDPPALC